MRNDLRHDDTPRWTDLREARDHNDDSSGGWVAGYLLVSIVVILLSLCFVATRHCP